jgi:hypothetical protein
LLNPSIRRILCYCSAGSTLYNMATCPHCKGHLTDSHRCPRRPAVVATEITLAGLAGGFAGLLVSVALNPGGEITLIDTIAVLTGAAIAIGTERFLRG